MPGPEKNQVKTVKSGAEASKALAAEGTSPAHIKSLHVQKQEQDLGQR